MAAFGICHLGSHGPSDVSFEQSCEFMAWNSHNTELWENLDLFITDYSKTEFFRFYIQACANAM